MATEHDERTSFLDTLREDTNLGLQVAYSRERGYPVTGKTDMGLRIAQRAVWRGFHNIFSASFATAHVPGFPSYRFDDYFDSTVDQFLSLSSYPPTDTFPFEERELFVRENVERGFYVGLEALVPNPADRAVLQNGYYFDARVSQRGRNEKSMLPDSPEVIVDTIVRGVQLFQYTDANALERRGRKGLGIFVRRGQRVL